MKKILKSMILCLLIVPFMVIFSACDDFDSLTYKVQFNSNGGNAVSSETITNIKPFVTKPEDPIKEGYTFEGWFYGTEEWDFDKNMVDSDITLDAKWSLAEFEIEYETYDDLVENNNPVTYTIESENITLSEVSRIGYVFDGWYDAEDFENANLIKRINAGSSGNVKLYAKWTAVPYTITYNLNGGANSLENIETYTIEDEVILKSPKKAGYAFYGWYDNEGCVGKPITSISAGSMENKELYAKWSEYTQSGAYIIHNVERLKNISMDADVVLDNDIDLSGVSWTSLGTKSAPFTGTFDGNGYKILNYSENEYKEYVGIFGQIQNATIKNIHLENVSISVPYEDNYELTTTYIAGIVAVSNNSSITNCSVSGNVCGYGFTETYVGGLVGYSNQTLIKNSNTSGKVYGYSGSEPYVGGLVGIAINSTKIENCYSSSEVQTSSASVSSFGGGLVSSVESSTITNSYATGKVTGDGYNGDAIIGGLIGKSQKSTIKQSYATGDIDLPYASWWGHVGGGFAGSLISSQISNCYSMGKIHLVLYEYGDTHQDVYVGGFSGSVSNSTISDSYSTSMINVTYSESVYDFNVVYAGGFVGRDFQNTNNSKYTNCYSFGNISVAGKNNSYFIGKFIGDLEEGRYTSIYTNCYASTEQVIETNCDSVPTINNLIEEKAILEIFAKMLENWDSEIWNFYGDKTPTLKSI